MVYSHPRYLLRSTSPKLVGAVGLEPTTFGLKVRHSSNWVIPREISAFWWNRTTAPGLRIHRSTIELRKQIGGCCWIRTNLFTQRERIYSPPLHRHRSRTSNIWWSERESNPSQGFAAPCLPYVTASPHIYVKQNVPQKKSLQYKKASRVSYLLHHSIYLFSIKIYIKSKKHILRHISNMASKFLKNGGIKPKTKNPGISRSQGFHRLSGSLASSCHLPHWMCLEFGVSMTRSKSAIRFLWFIVFVHKMGHIIHTIISLCSWIWKTKNLMDFRLIRLYNPCSEALAPN